MIEEEEGSERKFWVVMLCVEVKFKLLDIVLLDFY